MESEYYMQTRRALSVLIYKKKLLQELIQIAGQTKCTNAVLDESLPEY